MLVLVLQFLLHTTKSSSTSKAHIKGLSLTMTNKSRGWTTDFTLAKFYNKPVRENYGTLVINTEKLNIFYCIGNKNNF